MNDEEAFHEALDADPADQTIRLVFADWLQERDDLRADGYRALGVTRRVPHKGGRYIGGKKVHTWQFVEVSNCYAWSGPFNNGDLLLFALPDDWIALTETCPDITNTNVVCGWREWWTRRDIEDRVALAFAALPADRRAKLLAAQQMEVSQ